MLLAIELVPNLSAHFAPHHRYIVYVKHGDDMLLKTRGADTFSFNGTLLPGEPLSGTGRSRCHRPNVDLMELRGAPAVPAEVPDAPLSELAFYVDTNAILSQEELQSYYALRITVNDRKWTLPLLLTKIHWEGQGLFKIYLSGLTQ